MQIHVGYYLETQTIEFQHVAESLFTPLNEYLFFSDKNRINLERRLIMLRNSRNLFLFSFLFFQGEQVFFFVGRLQLAADFLWCIQSK